KIKNFFLLLSHHRRAVTPFFVSLIWIVGRFVRSIMQLSKAILVQFFWRRLQEFRQQPRHLMVAILMATSFWLWLGPRAGILWFTLLLFMFFRWDERLVGGAALIALTTCPILFFLKKDEIAETMAVWTFFLLVMTIILQIIHYWRHPERLKD
ncbi:MAG: hypothetical protein KJ864_06440, partial [Candidatus Omnitrophica bacterium]|nr:hypothetical protein [Candidatus Omnitrophota bacterium]